MAKIKLKAEWPGYCVLLLTLTLLLWFGPGRIWDHRIDHGYPYAFNAGDAFQHQARAEAILRIGNYKYEPMEYIQGDYPEFPGYYPPLFSELTAVWASFPGLETFHAAPGLVFLSTITSAALMYFLIRRFSTIVAILSLPLYGYLFLSKIAFTYYTWGHWPSIFGQALLILVAWIISRMESSGWEIILTLTLAGVVMAYTAWAIFGAIFLFFFLIIYAINGGKVLQLILRLALVGSIVLILISRYLVIFLNILLPTDPYTSFVIITEWAGGGGAPAVGFPGIPPVLLGGMAVLALYTLVCSIKQKKKLQTMVPLIFSITMFILGFSNYFGFTKRAFLLRLFWPFYLSLFLGLTLYYGGRIILQLNGKRWTAFRAAIVMLLLITIIIAAVEKPVSGKGTMNPQLWQAFTWLRDSTPQDSTIWVMYGDGFVGDLLWNLQKPHISVINEAYFQALQNLSVHRHYSSFVGTNQFAYWVVPTANHKENPLFWGWSWNMSSEYLLFRDRDLCSTDYILFTKQSYQPVLVQYGLYIANLLLEKPWMTVALQNDYALILHNAKPGEACIEDQKIQQA